MFIFSSHQANRLIYTLFLWPLCNCSVDGPLWSYFATESSVECMASADQRCHSLIFNSVNTAFQEGKFKLQNLLIIIWFFLPFSLCIAQYQMQWTVSEKGFPTYQSSQSTLCSCLVAFEMPPFQRGGTRLLDLCANVCIRPELHRSTLRSSRAKNHLFGDVLPGTSWGCDNPLGSFNSTGSCWRGWRGLRFILTLHSPPKTQTKVRRTQNSHSCNSFSSMISQFVHFTGFEGDTKIFILIFKQQNYVSLFWSILFAIKNFSKFHNPSRHRNSD